MFPLLETIDDPAALRRLDRAQLPELARELRAFLISSVARTGGHLSSNLGTVELAIALHYVFDTPRRPHRLGRRSPDVRAQDPHRPPARRWTGCGCWTGPRDSRAAPRAAYDTFGTAHSSTSISAALGMAIAAQQRGESRRVVAVIGDGAMSAGMAFEALNNAGIAGADLLVVLNDNEMSISEPVGALQRLSREPPVVALLQHDAPRQQGSALEGPAGQGAREALGRAHEGDGAARHAVRGIRLQLYRPDRRPRHRRADAHARQREGAQRAAAPARDHPQRATAMPAPRTTRSSITASRSSIPPWASLQSRPPSPRTRRSSATGCATWRRATSASSRSRRRCAKARASCAFRRNITTAISTSASPSSMR